MFIVHVWLFDFHVVRLDINTMRTACIHLSTLDDYSYQITLLNP